MESKFSDRQVLQLREVMLKWLAMKEEKMARSVSEPALRNGIEKDRRRRTQWSGRRKG